MVRDLTEIAVGMIKQEQRRLVESDAKNRVTERLIDMLLPGKSHWGSDEGEEGERKNRSREKWRPEPGGGGGEGRAGARKQEGQGRARRKLLHNSHEEREDAYSDINE